MILKTKLITTDVSNPNANINGNCGGNNNMINTT